MVLWHVPRLLLLALLLTSAGCRDAKASQTGAPKLIVRLRDGAAAAAAAAAGQGGVGIAGAGPGITNVQLLSPSLNMFTVEVDGGNAAQRAAELQQLPGVVFAEIDGQVSLSRNQYVYLKPPNPPRHRPRPPPPTPHPPPPRPRPLPSGPFPNDPFYLNGTQWGLQRIKAQRAWPRVSNASSVLACVVDTGVMWNHPDLVANLHSMPRAYRRANFDDNGHGTHVAGILGAVGNNGIGIAGTALQANVLACKALSSLGTGSISDVVRCIDVCRERRAEVINLSVNTWQDSQALKESIEAATKGGALFVNSAGNFALDLDITPYYPSSYTIPGFVAVAGTQQDNRLESRSNYGANTVGLAAPGFQIFSTILPGYNSPNYSCGKRKLYCYEDGTSQAAPFVAGAAALAKAASGGRLTNLQLATLLGATSDPYRFLRNKVKSGGIINVNRLILRVEKACPRRGGRCQL